MNEKTANPQSQRIPVTRVTGAGSQPADEDFDFLPVPTRFEALYTPVLPLDMPASAVAVAREILGWLSQALADYHADPLCYPSYELSDQQRAHSTVIDQVFAEGEVSARVLRPQGGETQIQETLFAGVWRLREYDDQQRLLSDSIEICPVPCCVWNLCQSPLSAGSINLPDELPGMMNGRFIAHEIRSRLQQTPVQPHVINLTLLPVNDADKAYLNQFLAEGASAIFSRGYGKCRIVSSRYPGVWRINYFNDNNTLLQDMIEICRIPDIVLAGKDDFTDSRQRINDVLAWLDREAQSGDNATHASQASAATPDDNARMECKICWWVYDPALGDDVWQIPPGTPFRLLPEYWRCPHCDADKSGFMVLADTHHAQ